MNEFSLALLLIGAIFILLAGVGLIKMPTLFMRMQAASKASTLGCILMLSGACFYFRSTEVFIKATVIIFFLLLTTPIAVHAMAEAAKKDGADQ